MPIRAKLAWSTAVMLVLGVEGLAGAQSAPPRAGRPADTNLALMRQWTTWVSPELDAARASLDESAKKGDRGAPVDLNGLASRQVAAGSALALPSDVGAPLPSDQQGDRRLQTLRGDVTGATPPAAGPATRVALSASDVPPDPPISTPAAPAGAVIRGQVNPAAKICYANDPDSKAKRHGRLLVYVQLAPSGDIDSVTIPVNIDVSPSVVECITSAVRAAKFAAPGAGGTTVRAAFTFPPQDDPPARAPLRTAHDTLAKAAAPPAKEEIARQ